MLVTWLAQWLRCAVGMVLHIKNRERMREREGGGGDGETTRERERMTDRETDWDEVKKKDRYPDK